jgi:PLP dependent protein
MRSSVISQTRGSFGGWRRRIVLLIAALMIDEEQQARERLNSLRARIGAGKHDQVCLIAISKTRSADEIRPLIAAGQRVFGENRVQEAQGKWPALRAETPGIELHLVGQLQSNKAEDAVALFDYIHSVDRNSLVVGIARAQAKTGKRARCFVQVNIGDEEQKGGCMVADIPALLRASRSADLDVVGLMAVPPLDVEPAPYFTLLAKLARDNGLDQLSMGMSSDFETAIMLGATHIRVGTALFGARD